jgi:Holliday junction resolvasome RuvABC endonuclease subunit
MAQTTLPNPGSEVNRRGLPVARHAGNGGVASPLPATASGGPGAHPGAILCLDLGTTTGYAIRFASGATLSGTRTFRSSRFDGGGMRFLRFRGWLDEVLRHCQTITSVFYEEVRAHAGTDAAHVYGGFLATLAAWCEEHGVPYEGVPVGAIKRHVAGKGNARKDDVIAAVRELGHEPADDNEADALALLHWVVETGAAGGAR